jgi:hypothetical protein
MLATKATLLPHTRANSTKALMHSPCPMHVSLFSSVLLPAGTCGWRMAPLYPCAARGRRQLHGLSQKWRRAALGPRNGARQPCTRQGLWKVFEYSSFGGGGMGAMASASVLPPVRPPYSLRFETAVNTFLYILFSVATRFKTRCTPVPVDRWCQCVYRHPVR